MRQSTGLASCSNDRSGTANVRDIRVKPDLLGHSNPRMTRHYSAPDITRLLEAAEKVVKMTREPVLRVVGR